MSEEEKTEIPWASLKRPCPECAAQILGYRIGSTLNLRCSSPECAWEMATIFHVPIYQDAARYTLKIPPLQTIAFAMLSVLNHRFTHGMLVTRTMALQGTLPVFSGRPIEVWNEAQRLRKANIPFSIRPPFPFDLDNPVSAFGPPDGPLAS